MTTWNSIDKATHARKRRAMNHPFSDMALFSSEPFIHSNIDRWIELLKEDIGEKQWPFSLHMARWADRLVFDTLGDLCFGESFGMKEHDSELRHIPAIIMDFTSTIHPIAYSPFTSLWDWLKPRGLDYLLAARAQIEDEVQARCKSGTESRMGFFHYLFLDLDLDISESESLIIAGSETSPISLAAAFFYLTRYPHAQEKLAKEFEAAFSSVDGIKGGGALHYSQYLRAFIQETMRMSPPVPADLAPDGQQGGIVVDGRYIPEGMKVSTVSYCMHHKPDMYPEPFDFRPER
ncbi:hypothetical protein FOMG_17930 [Fusarium oxysporum f. sp. melonis 26406]|uniref:Cytochrome P450 n=1 Tax=Fusarium oxysporum f. sp. melonis 26406 TaxID=1089452 RepID=W9Z207_FUSOX|nr:hypothetical protein FOMG_17930 [Fusarium oxysporum f. sp. melonis 26406]